MEALFAILAIVVAIALLFELAQRLQVPYPSLFLVGGVALGLIPGLPHIALEPELVLLVFLPPLLFEAAVTTPARDLKTDIWPIVRLSVALVLLTMLVVGVVGHFAIGLEWAAAFTLGAGLLLSPLAVFFSDVVELVGVAMMLLFYLTPVIYPEDVVAGRWFAWVIESGPVRPILQLFRAPIYEGVLPAASTVGVCVLLALVALGVGTLVFRRSSDLIPFYI